MPTYEFSVPFCAGKMRPRIAGKRAYKDSAETVREQAIALAFDEIDGEKAPKGSPVQVSITAVKSSKKPGGQFVGKPDADNIAKLVLDALNGKAWEDDSQVIDLHVSKDFYSENVDRISVSVKWRKE